MLELRPHQEKALAELQNGNILLGGVGTGKSRVAVAYYRDNEAPRPVYVITTAKKRDSRDWTGEFARIGVGEFTDATVSGVLTVDSWNNLGKYTEVKDAFFVFDEQRLVGSGEWAKSFIRIAQHNRWILLTATPGDTWLDYITVFIANGWYKNRTEFKREHVVYNHYSRFPKVDRYLGVRKLFRLRNSVLVHMPYERHTTRRSENVPVSYNQAMFDRVVKHRWHVYEERPLRDVAELFVVMRRVVNSDTSRVTTISSLLHRHPRLIVFYNFDYELEILRTIVPAIPDGRKKDSPAQSVSPSTAPTSKTDSSTEIPIIKTAEWNGPRSKTSESNAQPCSASRSSKTGNGTGCSTSEEETGSSRTTEADTIGFQLAEWNGHRHQPIPQTSRWVYLVQYAAGAEGWNCTLTDAMCFYSLTYSYKLYHQAHGRIDRLNTPYNDLWYYTLISDSAIDRAIHKALKEKRSFNERELS